MDLKVRRIDSFSELETIAPRWEALSLRARMKQPFTSPRWLLPWWSTFSQSRALLSDTLRCYTFSTSDGELVGIAPMMVTSRPAHGPVRLRQLQVLGADPNITEVNPVLADPAHEADVYRALLRRLDADGGWDWAIFWVASGSGGEEALNQQPYLTWSGERPAFLLSPGESWDTFRASRARNIKESVRKCYNSLARAGHTFTLHVRTAGPELRLALERFFSLHRERATLSGTVTHNDWFSTPLARAFLSDTVERFAEAGQVRLFELEVAGDVIASRLAFVLGDALYLYYSGYRLAWSKFSVMTTTTTEAIRYAIREGLTTVNLSYGRDVSKTRWSPDELMWRGATLVAPSMRSRLSVSAYETIAPRLRGALRTFFAR